MITALPCSPKETHKRTLLRRAITDQVGQCSEASSILRIRAMLLINLATHKQTEQNQNARVSTCAMNRLVPATATELLRTTTSANSTNTHHRVRRATQDRANTVYSPRQRSRRERKFMQQRRVPTEFRHLRLSALICRQSSVNPVDAKCGVGCGPPHTDDTQSVKRKAGHYTEHGCDHR